MLNHAKMKLKQLLFDDSGVAMAYTIWVFLFIFLLCVSVYAMSENIRQKMELQNACDAAAYSGAVVQADMLSRIAVLNRALSWTYLQTNKRQMDYLVGLWAMQVQRIHQSDSQLVLNLNAGACLAHKIKGRNYYASIYPINPYYIKMRNYYENERNVKEHVSSSELTRQIGYGNNNMQLIMREISYIRNNINIFIKNAVDEVWTRSGMSNSSYPARKLLLLGGVNSASGPNYFSNVNEENPFLAFSGSTASNMGNGQGVWWNLKGTKIQRTYTTGGLTAQYWRHSEYCTKYVHRIISIHDLKTIPLWMDYSSLEVTGTSLKKEFFGKAGSIVVAAKRPLTNPFAWMGDDSTTRGLYDAFTPNGNFDMWAVSAARAGVRLRNDQRKHGHYVVQYPGVTASGYTNGVWNLCEEDWDAVLIPVSRAWNETTTGAWVDKTTAEGLVINTAEELLEEVKAPRNLNIRTRYVRGIGRWLWH